MLRDGLVYNKIKFTIRHIRSGIIWVPVITLEDKPLNGAGTLLLYNKWQVYSPFPTGPCNRILQQITHQIFKQRPVEIEIARAIAAERLALKCP